jgi:hypothetical protein
MRVALIGASGKAGSRILGELLRRGHHVTGIARKSDLPTPQAGFEAKRGNASDAAGLAPLLTGHDAVISATRFVSTDAGALIEAVKQAGVPRFLVVGGAGSLQTAAGIDLVDTPGIPDTVRPESSAGRDFLNRLRAERELDWTFLCPSGSFAPGAQTGKFRLGSGQLLVDANGASGISMEDFAIAMVDELETPRHSRRRFTVGY